MCDAAGCNNASTGGYSVGMFAVEFCDDHRQDFEDARTEHKTKEANRQLRRLQRSR